MAYRHQSRGRGFGDSSLGPSADDLSGDSSLSDYFANLFGTSTSSSTPSTASGSLADYFASLGASAAAVIPNVSAAVMPTTSTSTTPTWIWIALGIGGAVVLSGVFSGRRR